MSTKAIIGIIAVIVIIGLGAWMYSNHQSASSQATTIETPSDSQGTQTTDSQSTNQTSQTTTSGNTSISSKNSSDATLNQDMNSIDTQMNGLNADNASADKGLTNQN